MIAFKKKIKNFEQQKIMIYIDTTTTYYILQYDYYYLY